MLPYVERMQQRSRIVRAVRRFFDEQDFLEVDTPVALSAPAPEVHLEAPAVELQAEGRQRRYLQTSPELPMKRLLADLPRIYQIAPAFRDGDFTRLHRPEFRILEWYRRGASWLTLMQDCEGLLRAAAAAAGGRLDFSKPFLRVSVDDAFREHAGFSILAALEREALAERLRAIGVHFEADDSWDDLFHRVFLTRVEPRLCAAPQPFFLTHYPAPLAALARLSPDDARVAERFELYAGGLELANAFGELTDAAEQRRRFEQDRALRRALGGRSDYPFDERFFAALRRLPESAGIALGIDRLLMVLLDAKDMDEVAFLPWSET
jgi:elongation factor P--(R)-beta-lysine ligase